MNITDSVINIGYVAFQWLVGLLHDVGERPFGDNNLTGLMNFLNAFVDVQQMGLCVAAFVTVYAGILVYKVIKLIRGAG